MKTSNFQNLIKQYVTKGTSKEETVKIQMMLAVIKEKDIHWISDETEELLFLRIKDNGILPKDIKIFIKALSKLHVSEVKWMKFKGMDVYFYKTPYTEGSSFSGRA